MDKKSKVKSGLRGGEKITIRQPNKCFTDIEKHHIIQEYMNTDITKREIWEKYTGRAEEHGALLTWMRQLGYNESFITRSSNFVSQNKLVMVKRKKPQNTEIEDFDILQLQKRIAELEDQLKEAELKAIAFSTMVDIAEQEFNIPIRKKYNTKPLKK